MLKAIYVLISLALFLGCTNISPKEAKEKKTNEDIKIGPLTYNVIGFKFVPTKQKELFQNIVSWRESAFFVVEFNITNTSDESLIVYNDYFTLYDKDDIDLAFPFQTPPSFSSLMKVEKEKWISIVKIAPKQKFSGYFVSKVPSPYDPRYTGAGEYLLHLTSGKYSKEQAMITLVSNIEKPQR